MSTSSDGPADPADLADTVPAGPGDTAPLPPPIVTSPPPSSLPSSAEPPLAPALTPAPAHAVPAPASATPIGARDGDLTPRWRYVLAAAWVIAFFAYAAVWQASVQIGIGTWWVGPRAQPTHTLVRVLPSLLSISMAMCAIYNVPRLVRLGAAGVVLATIVAIPDFSRSFGLGVAELVIAGLLGLVTVAALTGRYRLVPDQSDGDTESNPELLDAAWNQTGDTTNAPHNGARNTADSDAAMALFAPPDQSDP